MLKTKILSAIQHLEITYPEPTIVEIVQGKKVLRTIVQKSPHVHLVFYGPSELRHKRGLKQCNTMWSKDPQDLKKLADEEFGKIVRLAVDNILEGEDRRARF